MDTKYWQTHCVFDSYEEADKERTALLEEHALVKIKRCECGGSKFKIKYWNKPLKKKEEKRTAKKSKKFKKGKK